MGMQTGKNNGRSVMSEINVTPFVDVMLVLLVIFMVTTPILYQGVDVNLPKTFGFDEACLWQHTRRPGRYRNPGLEVNGQEVDYANGAYGPDLVNDYALGFIERNKAKPFFLYYPMMLTHAPYDPTPDSPDYGDRGTTRQQRRRANGVDPHFAFRGSPMLIEHGPANGFRIDRLRYVGGLSPEPHADVGRLHRIGHAAPREPLVKAAHELDVFRRGDGLKIRPSRVIANGVVCVQAAQFLFADAE